MATSEVSTATAEGLRPSSSIAGEVWHGDAPTPAYEWWYFDALSDDGRDALVVIFLTNFVFSPRYNRAAAESLRQSGQSSSATQFPAVAVCFYRDGRPLFRAINEYPTEAFQANVTYPECSIGKNSFRLVMSGSQPRYELNIETALRPNRIFQARLEWTMQAGDFFAEATETVADAAAHHWNMVAPRCGVSGEVAIIERNGASSFENNFRGTGYHDHNRDTRWMPATVDEWQWGRFHFPQTTAVFYCYRERDNENAFVTRLYLIRENSLSAHSPQLKGNQLHRHFFGLQYPGLLSLQTKSETHGPSLRIRQQRIIDSSFFYLRFLSEATLEMAEGRVEEATGITEHLAPKTLRFPWLRWLINMRIGSGGSAAFLP